MESNNFFELSIVARDANTGKEVSVDLSDYTIVSLSTILKQRELVKARTQKEFGYRRLPIESRFCWALYNPGYELLSPLSPVSVTRVMFLATYLSYDGYLSFDNNKLILPKHMRDLLGISEQTATTFMQEVLDTGIFTLKDGKIRVSKKLFCKGSMTPDRIGRMFERDIMFTKIYVGPVRELYDKGHHKQLSYLFRAIPFLNRKYNVLCHDPWEEDVSRIECLTPEELCDVFDYSRNQYKRFTDMMTSHLITVDGIEQKACVYTKMPHLPVPGFFVNPVLCYAGLSPNYEGVAEHLKCFLPQHPTGVILHTQEEQCDPRITS